MTWPIKHSTHKENKPFPLFSEKSDKSDTHNKKFGAGFLKFLPDRFRNDWVCGLLLIIVTFAAYGPSLTAGFIWDDDSFLTDNPVIKNVGGLSQLWFSSAVLDYVPLTSSTLWLEWRLWGTNPAGYHLVNVLLHALASVLLWHVFKRFNVRGAWLAATIFALHPVNVESVAWITERKNTLCMFFYAGSLLSWLKFEDSGKWRWYGMASGAFALALLSKTAVAPLPLVLLAMAWWRRRRVETKDVIRVIPFCVMAAALALVAAWFQYQRAIGPEVIRTDGFGSRLATAGTAVWFYLYKTILPLNLMFVYPRWQIGVHNISSFIPLGLLTGIFIFCWRSERSWAKGVFFGLAYFVVMLSPVLGFLNIYFMRYSLVADHWQYFAILGPILLITSVINRRPILAVIYLMALAILTWNQCGRYNDAEMLWQTTLRQNPNCWLARGNLGDIFAREGRLDDSINQYQEALRINSGYAEGHNNLGVALQQKGKVNEAIEHYRAAINIRPNFAQAHSSLGDALRQQGELNEAILQYQESLRDDPNHAATHNRLGSCLLQAARPDEAIPHFQQALKINSDDSRAHYNLGNAFLLKGNTPEAIDHFQQALQITPNDPGIQNNLAWVLATCPDPLLRNGGKAVELAEEAVRFVGGENSLMLGTLAAAYAEAGRFPEAVETVQRSLHLAEMHSDSASIAKLQFQLKLYQAGKPLRIPDSGLGRPN